MKTNAHEFDRGWGPPCFDSFVIIRAYSWLILP